MNQVITLQDLELYDAHPQKIGRESRFLCSLSASCREKSRDAGHRSLCVNLNDGFYFCHRCQAKGKLQEFWEERPKINKKQIAYLKLAARFSPPTTIINSPVATQTAQTAQSGMGLDEKMKAYDTAFSDSAAEKYLQSRRIPPEIARQTGCGYAANWEHWEKRDENWHLTGVDKRVVFPIVNERGELVAIHGRAIDNKFFNSPKITKGDKSLGVFLTPDALRAKVVAICEGQVDALALWSCGIAAAAMTGTSAPPWLMRKLAFRHVLLATDADEAGDKAAFRLQTELESRAAKVFRLRPREGKDWAEVLEKTGIAQMREKLAAFAVESDDVRRVNTALGSGFSKVKRRRRIF